MRAVLRHFQLILGLIFLNVAGFGCASDKAQQENETFETTEREDVNDSYDFLDGGFDVTESYEEDDWFYDYYEYDEDEFVDDLDYHYHESNQDNESNQEDEADWEKEKYQWEEEGLFEN